MPKRNKLKQRIAEEMTVNYSGVLEKNFDIAKQFMRVTKDGKVDVLSKDKLSGKEQILLYLIGKLYAREAGYALADEVGNEELMGGLGIPIGSLLPWLKDLRDKNKIRQIKKERRTFHTIPINLVERTLRKIESKLKKGV